MLKRKFVLPWLLVVGFGCTPAVDRDTAMENARTSVENGQLNEAKIELQNLLVDSPEDKEARRLLGNVLLSMGNYAGAEKQYKRAVALGEPDVELLLNLARAQIRLGNMQAVLDQEFDERALAPDELAQMYVYKGIAAIGLDQREESAAYFERAKEVGSSSDFAVLGDVYLTSSEGGLSEAVKLLEELTQQNPQLPEAQLLLGQLALRLNDFKKAISAFETYRELQPESREARVLLASALIQDQQYDKAKDITDRLLGEFPKHPFINQLRAIIAFNEKDYEAAKLHATNTLQGGLKSEVALVIKGISDYQLKNYEQSYFSLKMVVDKLPPNHPARRLYVLTQIHLGFDEQASATIREWQSIEANDVGVVAMLGSNLAREGNKEEAREILNELRSVDLQSAEDIARLGLLKIQLDDMSGVEDLQKALAKNEALEGAKLALIDVFLKTRDHEALQEFGEQLLQSDANQVLGYNTIALAYREKGDPEGAAEAYSKAMELEPLNPPSRVYFATQALQQGDRKKAISILEPLVEQKPEYVEGVKMLVGILAQQDLNRGVSVIKRAIEKAPENTDLKILLARVYLRQQKFDEVLSVLKPDSKDLEVASDEFFLVVLETYLQSDRLQSAENWLEKWVRAQPTNETAAMSQIGFFTHLDRQNAAYESLQRALSSLPDSLNLKALEVRQLIERGNIRQAQKAFSRMPDSLRHSIVGQGLLGHILLRQQRAEQALPLLEAYYELAPNQFNAKGVIAALRANEDKEGILTFLKKRIEQAPTDIYSRTLLADLALFEDPDFAQQQYEKIVQLQPTNLLAANNLAWLMLQKNELQGAKAIAEQALQVRDDVPALLDTLGQIESRLGNHERAVELFDKAYNADPSPSITLHYAQALAETGQKAKSKEILKNIAQNDNKEIQQQVSELRKSLK